MSYKLNWCVRERECGIVIDYCSSRSEAEDVIHLMEEDDKLNGCYKDNYYEVVHISDVEGE